MRRVLLLVLVLLLAAVSCRGPKRIPRDDMEEIFYQMFLQDQQIKQTPKLKKQADTMLVYEGIFESLGYNTDDYLHSLRYYLEEPEKMEKVMGAVASRLDKDVELAKKAVELERWQQKMLAIYRQHPDTTRAPKQGPRIVDTLRVRFEGDSVYLYKPIDSLQLVPQDSLLYFCDSLVFEADTLVSPVDSL
ncbi:MAG: DUF4296 domain-containing protein [Bacteroidales bacterium]|nr:DUF4296 domain-containing protein [Bacteroidales bacterium]